jgi:hypothetical protein
MIIHSSGYGLNTLDRALQVDHLLRQGSGR